MYPLKTSLEDVPSSQGKPSNPFAKTTTSRYSLGEPITGSNISPREIDSQLVIAPVKIFTKTSLSPLRQNGAFTDLEQKVRSGTSIISIKKKGTLEDFKNAQYNNLGNGFVGRRSISERKLRAPSPRKEGESLITQNPICVLKIQEKNISEPEFFTTEPDPSNFKEKSFINKPVSPKRSPKLSEKPVISINPLFLLNHPSNEGILLTQNNINNFKKSIFAIFFNEKKSAKKLFSLIRDYSKEENRKVFIDLICDIYIKTLKTKKIDRLHRVIALTITKHGNEKFFCDLVNNGRIEINEFAKNMAIEFKKDSNISFSFLSILARVTDYELNFQSPQTLFRERNFSSALCREYAIIVWGDELKKFCDGLSNKLEKIGPLKLCLNPQLIQEHLVKEDPSFKTLSSEMCQKQIQSHLQSNVESFKEFTQSIVSEIFNMKISTEIKIMLSWRRSQIIEFLSKSQNNENSKERSRTYISEVLILRILNPQIISLSESNHQNPIIRNIVVKLSKIIQALGNQTPCNDEGEIIIDQAFKDLYDCSIEGFCNFIDQCSSNNSDKENK